MLRLTVLLLMTAALSQPLRAAAPAADTAAQLEEVLVTTATLKDLQVRIDRLEDAFYERFNALNTVRDFDTHCHQEARIGTRIERRYCRAVYVDKALEKEAQDYTIFLQRSSSKTVNGGPPPSAMVDIEPRREAYRQNLRDVVGRHPELLELLAERSKLGERYETLHRKTFGATGKTETPP